jgi:hypothetical protein
MKHGLTSSAQSKKETLWAGNIHIHPTTKKIQNESTSKKKDNGDHLLVL